MKRIVMLACALLLTAGPLCAQTPVEKDRNWGFGWDNGLTLRRNLGRWQVGVSAGPNDYLNDRFQYSFGTDLPDTAQGIQTDDDRVRRESGFVRLHLTREMATYQTLKFEGLLSGRYSWSDFKSDSYEYYYFSDEYHVSGNKEWNETYSLSLGSRLSWFPVPFLSLETEFGLIYQWQESDQERWSSRMGVDDWERRKDHERRHSFDSFGPSSLTGDVQIVLWF